MVKTVRISELAEQSGVAVATVKYYLREGLLPQGTAVTARLADYGDPHVRRLRLLRVLREVGRTSISQLRELAEAVETRATVHEVFAAAAGALAPTPPPGGANRAEARRIADELVAGVGWDVRPGAPDRDNLAAVLERFLDLNGVTPPTEALQLYLHAADTIAAAEIDSLPLHADRARLLEQMVIGQVLFGELLQVLRRMAEEHYSQRRFGDVTG